MKIGKYSVGLVILTLATAKMPKAESGFSTLVEKIKDTRLGQWLRHKKVTPDEQLSSAIDRGNYAEAVLALSRGADSSRYTHILRDARWSTNSLAMVAHKAEECTYNRGNKKIIDYYHIAGLLVDHGARSTLWLDYHRRLWPYIELVRLLEKRGLKVNYYGVPDNNASTLKDNKPLEGGDYATHAPLFSRPAMVKAETEERILANTYKKAVREDEEKAVTDIYLHTLNIDR